MTDLSERQADAKTDEVCRSKIVENMIANLEPQADRAELLELYHQVHRGKRVPDDEANPLIDIMRLSGIARAVDGRLL